MMREKHNITKRNVAMINLQLYNASTKVSVVALIRSCGTTELRNAANLWKTAVLSRLILLKSISIIEMNKIKFLKKVKLSFCLTN
jgi:hypothetical protein